MNFKARETEINKIIEYHYQVIDSYFIRRKITLEEMKTKIEMILDEEMFKEK